MKSNGFDFIVFPSTKLNVKNYLSLCSCAHYFILLGMQPIGVLLTAFILHLILKVKDKNCKILFSKSAIPPTPQIIILLLRPVSTKQIY